jgi:hypothetical protein
VTDRKRNIAVFYAALEVASSLYPYERARWEAMLRSVGLDPDLASTDLVTPAGIGRAAGRAVVAARERDGMNQLGDGGGASSIAGPTEGNVPPGPHADDSDD